jgi:hypothetical protein
MSPKNIQHWAKARGIKDAEWVAETLAVGGTGTSAGRRDNIVKSQIRAYGLAKGIDGKKGMGDKKLTDFLEYLVQTIEELTPHIAKFQRSKKGVQTDDAVQFMAPLHYFTQEALRSARVAGLFESSKKSKKRAVEPCMKSHPSL